MPGRRPARRRPGRRTLLTPARKTVLLDALRDGNFRTHACLAAGVEYQTFKEWMRRGRGEDHRRPAKEPYISFAREVQAAEAEAILAAQKAQRAFWLKDPASVRYWQQKHLREYRDDHDPLMLEPGEEPQQPRLQSGNVIVLTPEEVQRIATRHVMSLNGELDVDDATRARRARLVSDHPTEQ